VVIVNEISYIGVLGMDHESKHVSAAYWVVISIKTRILGVG